MNLFSGLDNSFSNIETIVFCVELTKFYDPINDFKKIEMPKNWLKITIFSKNT